MDDYVPYEVIMERAKDDIDYIAEQAYERGKRDILEQLQSAQSEREKGEWTEKEVFWESEVSAPITEWQSARCSKCGKYLTTPYLYNFDNFGFCPHCGKPMKRGEQDDNRRI